MLGGVYKDFRVARWLLPDDDPVLRLGLDTSGGWTTARRVLHARQFTIGPRTVGPYHTHPGDNNTPRHEIVERLWLGSHTHWRDSIPTERLTAVGIDERATTLLLTRIWRWRGDGFAVAQTTIAAEALPEDGPWL